MISSTANSQPLMSNSNRQLHFHVIKKIAEGLDQIFLEAKYPDKVIEKIFKSNLKLGSRDRRFIAETIYEVIRYYRFFTEVAESKLSYNLIAAYLIKNSYNIQVFADEYPLDQNLIKKNLSKNYSLEISESYPDWLNHLGESEFGKERWQSLMKALNRPADVYLRANTLLITAENLKSDLAREDIHVEILHDQCLRLTERKNVFQSQAFKKGLFEVQDGGSQMIAPLLDIKPGLRVVDACSGSGGKALHLASLMKNKGKVIALDIHDWKLNELKKRSRRNKIDIIETKLIDSKKVIKRFENSFDRVLLDVPCSGLGVLRRNPDTKWKSSLEEIERLKILQAEILQDYSKMCKVGGLMVYATCSILNQENENQVKIFLDSSIGQSWVLKKELRVWPNQENFDGFYAAVLEKKL